MQFLVTNHGTHPPDKWAELMTSQILDFIKIEGQAATEADNVRRAGFRRAKMELQPTLFNALELIFDDAQKAEKADLRREGVARVVRKIEHQSAVDDALDKLAVVFAATPFAGHFAKPEVVDVLRRMLAQYIGNVIHIERSVEADKNPKAEEAKAFHAKHHPEG